MCHSWVKRIIRHDKKKVLKFAPLEGSTAEKILKPIMPDYVRENTLILYDEGRIYIRSNAVIRIMEMVGYTLPAISKFVPRALRDKAYNWVAGRRYRYGERYDSCPLPPLESRDRFLP